MILTFEHARYIDLLSEYQPKSIETESENDRALAMIEKLMHLSTRTPEQQELYELLIVLIEKFEQEFYQPVSETNPRSMLAFLMEQRDLKPSDLVDIFGSAEAVTDVLTGKAQIDRATADLLGQIFHVDMMLFIQ
jgi:HTH-type transcriptional regulator / antitoxin HigA